MSLARVCDRCGKTATEYFYSISSKKCSFEKWSFGKFNCEDDISYSDKNYYELCSECMDKFKNFISYSQLGE